MAQVCVRLKRFSDLVHQPPYYFGRLVCRRVFRLSVHSHRFRGHEHYKLQRARCICLHYILGVVFVVTRPTELAGFIYQARWASSRPRRCATLEKGVAVDIRPRVRAGTIHPLGLRRVSFARRDIHGVSLVRRAGDARATVFWAW